MKSVKSIIVLLIVGALLAACGSVSKKAAVEDRTLQKANNQGVAESPGSASVLKADQSYTVKKGDTLYRIALERAQSYSDILAWNNLSNPHDIKVGQVLRVVPPETSTNVVASPTGIDVRPLGSVKAGESAVSSAPSANNKNGPRADKRPYSAATLAELQKSDAADAVKAPEKSAESESNDQIVWGLPVEGKVMAGFDNGKNKGIDFSGKLGQNVYAAAAGTVMYAGSGIRGYGNLVIIKHSNNFLSAYAHNRAILVKEKQMIGKGQKIAEMGNSDSDVVKLHFEIRQQGKPVDPMKFLPTQ